MVLESDEDDFDDDEYDQDYDEIDIEKNEIIEDCTTCLFKKNGTCSRARYNVLCDNYIYKSKFLTYSKDINITV